VLYSYPHSLAGGLRGKLPKLKSQRDCTGAHEQHLAGKLSVETVGTILKARQSNGEHVDLGGLAQIHGVEEHVIKSIYHYYDLPSGEENE